MDGLCDQLFTRSAFTLDEDIGIGRRYLFDNIENTFEAVALADDIGEGILLVQLTAEGPVFVKQLTLENGVFDRLQQIFVDERFRDVIVGTFSQRRDGGVHRRVGGHYYHQRFLVDRLDLIEQLQTVHPGHLYVGERHGYVVLGKDRQRSFGAVGREHGVPGVLEQASKYRTHELFVFDDQHALLGHNYTGCETSDSL